MKWALQAIGSFRICTGFLMVMVSVAFSGHISMVVLAGAESGVMRIQTLEISVLVGLHLKFSLFVMNIVR